MKEQIIRGISFVRETTIEVKAFYDNEGGMGEATYCKCGNITEAYAKLEEAKKMSNEPWVIVISVDDYDHKETETKQPISRSKA